MTIRDRVFLVAQGSKIIAAGRLAVGFARMSVSVQKQAESLLRCGSKLSSYLLLE